MTERELAGTLLDMGLKSGLDMERAAEEIAAMSLPSFVNARSFRAAVLESVEAHMRSQLEQRLQAMRQRLDTPVANVPPIREHVEPTPPVARVNINPVISTRPEPVSDVGSLDTIIGDMTMHDEGSPDATIVWSPRRD